MKNKYFIKNITLPIANAPLLFGLYRVEPKFGDAVLMTHGTYLTIKESLKFTMRVGEYFNVHDREGLIKLWNSAGMERCVLIKVKNEN